jgi:serine/threonine protein phosphatase PrpC
MKIAIRQPLWYSEQGERKNQEDSFYPAQATPDSRFFIVCDGMGGHAKGEVASRLVCDTLGEYFNTHPLTDGVLTEEEMNKALDAVYDAMDAADTGEDEKKMGTTLTFIYLHRGGCSVAHIGDSRIYQVRTTGEARLVYQSTDHSLVYDLLRIGELTPEEVKTDPRRNILTRAMQPHQSRRQYAEIHLMDDVEAGDYFFLCSDGVMEQMTNEKLVEILSKEASDEEKLRMLKAVGFGQTRDNHTGYLIPIEQVVTEEDIVTKEADAADLVADTPKVSFWKRWFSGK